MKTYKEKRTTVQFEVLTSIFDWEELKQFGAASRMVASLGGELDGDFVRVSFTVHESFADQFRAKLAELGIVEER